MRICPRSVAALLAALTALTATPAAAGGSLHLNGVNIDGVVSQEFTNVRSVRIDADGNVFIDAPGYRIDGASPAAKTSVPANAPAAGPVTRRYFLVTEVPAPGQAGYDVDVFVNAKWIRKIRNEEEQVYLELTPHLKRGRNTVLFRSTKRPKRTSASPDHFVSVVIGSGEMSGDRVMIDDPLVEYRRTAAETDSSDREFYVVAQ